MFYDFLVLRVINSLFIGIVANWTGAFGVWLVICDLRCRTQSGHQIANRLPDPKGARPVIFPLELYFNCSIRCDSS